MEQFAPSRRFANLVTVVGVGLTLACSHSRPAGPQPVTAPDPGQLPHRAPSSPAAGTVEGRVLWNEQPVPGARVYATDEYSFSSTHYGMATTDAAGRFSIPWCTVRPAIPVHVWQPTLVLGLRCYSIRDAARSRRGRARHISLPRVLRGLASRRRSAAYPSTGAHVGTPRGRSELCSPCASGRPRQVRVQPRRS